MTFCPVGNTPTGTKGCASHVGAGSTFCPGWCYQPGQKVLYCPGCQTRDKRAPLLSRTGVSAWETGTTGVSQPGQINVFVVVFSPYIISQKCLLQLKFNVIIL